MASEFRINQKRFELSFDRKERHAPLPQESIYKRLNRLSLQQNAYLVGIDLDIAEFDANDAPLIQRLEITAKVVHGLIMVLMIVMPVAFSYLPAWLPWGVGLPTYIILGLISGKLKEKIELKKQHQEALQLMRKMLVEQSTHALRPFGEWTLPAVDRRVKSDILMQEELSKKHPESASHIDRLVSNVSSCGCPDHAKKKNPKPLYCLDLEVTPLVKMQAARKLVQRPDNMTDWGALKERVIQAKQLLAEGKFTDYEAQMAGIKLEGLKVGKGAVPLIGLVPPSPKMQLQSIVSNFQRLNQIYEGLGHKSIRIELYNRYQEGLALFGDQFYVGWEAHLESVRKVQEEVERLVQLLARGDKVSDKEWILAANSAYLPIMERGTPQNIALNTMIDSLIERSLQMERVMARKIATHETKRRASYREGLVEMENDKKILSRASVNYLQRWTTEYPEKGVRPIGEWISIFGKEREPLPKQREIDLWICNNLDSACQPIKEVIEELPAEVGEWLNRNAEAGALLVEELLYGPQIRAWLQANEELTSDPVVEIYQRNLLMRNEFDRVLDLADRDLTSFEQAYVALQKLVVKGGEPSRARSLWQKISRKLPAHRFEPIKAPKKGGWARSRKIEAFVYEKLLQQVDRKMVIQNRVRRYSLVIVVQGVLLILQAIFWSNIYVTFGISTVMVLIQLLDAYFDKYLTKVNKEKQGLKMQMILRDQSNLTNIPGSRPIIEKLKGAQDTFGLDGVTRTWARMTTEGEEAVLSDHWREIARKGSEQAIPALERRLLYLLALQAKGELDPEFATRELQEERIKSIQDSLYYTPSRQKAPPHIDVLQGELSKATKERQQIEMRLERVAKEREKMERLRAHGRAFFVTQLILKACAGEHARESDGDLAQEIETMGRLVTQKYDEGESEELNRELNEVQERLKLFPVEALREQLKSVDAAMIEMERRDQECVEEVLFLERVRRTANEWREEISLFDPVPLLRRYRIYYEQRKQLSSDQPQSEIDRLQFKLLKIEKKVEQNARRQLRLHTLQISPFSIEENERKYIQISGWERSLKAREQGGAGFSFESLAVIREGVTRLHEEFSRFDDAPFRRTYRIGAQVKQLVEQACRGNHTRRGEGSLEFVTMILYALLEKRETAGLSPELNNEITLAYEQLKRFPIEELELLAKSWGESGRVQPNLVRIEQSMDGHAALNSRLQALQRRFALAWTYQELVESERRAKDELKQALAFEREKKILFALEKQVIKMDAHIEQKREAVQKVRGGNAVNQMLKVEKETLAASLARAKNKEAIYTAVAQLNQHLREAMNPRGVSAALINQLLEQELKIIRPFRREGDLVPELAELISTKI